MKRFTWALVLLFALFCSAHANSVYTFNAFQVTYVFGANEGATMLRTPSLAQT